MHIIATKKFEKNFDNLVLTLKQKTRDAIKIFIDNPMNPILHNHALQGNYGGYRSIDVTGDLRIVFKEVGPHRYEIIELHRVGTHSQLYG